MEKTKRIAMIAHDNKKKDLIEWVEWNWEILQDHQIICTGTTGRLVEESLSLNMKGRTSKKPDITKLKSGPLGGDQQMGSHACPASRCGCKGPFTHRSPLQYTDCL